MTLRIKKKIPYITISYAQSIDGTISRHDGKRLMLSSPESLAMTHALRANNDAVLVGVGTVLSDDPFLTVRYATGRNPRPVVVDSGLRITPDTNLFRNPVKPWIFTTFDADVDRELTLVVSGAKVIRTAAQDDGRVSLVGVLENLHRMGIRTLMVEGGRKIITSFIRQRLVDRIIITIAPVLVGGYSAISQEFDLNPVLPELKNVRRKYLGKDLVIEGNVEFGEEN